MKQFVILLLISLTILSCSNNSVRHIFAKDDTILTEAHYIIHDWNVAYTGPLIKVIKDTFILQNTGNSSEEIRMKKVPIKDSIYFAPLLDTLKQNGKIVLDSATKKPKTQVNFHYIHKDFVLADYNKHIK